MFLLVRLRATVLQSRLSGTRRSCWLEGRSRSLIFSILDVVARSRPRLSCWRTLRGLSRPLPQFLSLFSERFPRSSPLRDCAIRLIGESLMPMALASHSVASGFLILGRVSGTWPTPAAAELRPVAWMRLIRSAPTELQAAGNAGLLPSIPGGRYQWHTNRERTSLSDTGSLLAIPAKAGEA